MFDVTNPATIFDALILTVKNEVFIKLDIVPFAASKLPVLVRDANTFDAEIFVASISVIFRVDAVIVVTLRLPNVLLEATKEATDRLVMLPFVTKIL